MVEVIEKNKKRQKTDKYDPQGGLTNLNFYEGIADEEEPRVGGQQLVIKFRDNEEKEVGV